MTAVDTNQTSGGRRPSLVERGSALLQSTRASFIGIPSNNLDTEQAPGRRRSSLAEHSAAIIESIRASLFDTPTSSHLDIEKIYNQTPTPDETPDLIQEKLAEFEVVLAKLDEKKKTGCLKAAEKCPGECNDGFKLVFLRCEVFKVEKAVDRWAKYWNTRIEVFGEEKAFLPLAPAGNLEGNDDASLFVQVAEKTDPEGRAIVVFDFWQESSEATSEALLQAFWYQVHIALRRESAQKRGIVVCTRGLKKYSDWRPSLSKQIGLSGKGILPVRFAGMHMINPPTFVSIILRFVRPVVGKKLRNRFYMHYGSKDELLESLARFGLGSEDTLPVLFGGKNVTVTE